MRYYYTPNRMTKIKNTHKPPVLRRMWSNRNSPYAGRNAKWNSHFGRQFSSFLQSYIVLKYNSTLLPLAVYPNQLKTYLHKNLHTNVYSILIHNCHNLKAMKISFSRCIDKQIVIYPYYGILFSDKRNELSGFRKTLRNSK